MSDFQEASHKILLWNGDVGPFAVYKGFKSLEGGKINPQYRPIVGGKGVKVGFFKFIWYLIFKPPLKEYGPVKEDQIIDVIMDFSTLEGSFERHKIIMTDKNLFFQAMGLKTKGAIEKAFKDLERARRDLGIVKSQLSKKEKGIDKRLIEKDKQIRTLQGL